MQGDQVRALRIVAERKGWDPTKVDGKPIEVGLSVKRPDEGGDAHLSPFPGPPADTNPDNPVMGESIGWAHPTDTSLKDRRGGGSDPFPGIPM